MGRLRKIGPQMFHGCSTDSIGGAGPLKHGDWLVQTVSTILIGGPHISSAHAAGVSDVIGQLRTATGRSVLVTEWQPQTPQYPLNDKIMDRTGPELSRGRLHAPGATTRSPRSTNEKPDGATGNESEKEREGETELANQSLAGV